MTYGTITSMGVSPPQPTVQDEIEISMGGYLPNSCWSVVGKTLSSEGNSFTISVFTHDSWYPGVFCFAIIIPYGATFSVGQLPPGDYTVQGIEVHNSLRNPLPEYANFQFTVLPCPCGDVDGNGSVNLSDALSLMDYVFGVDDLPSAGKKDVNCDGKTTMADVVYLVWHIFGGGPDPCDPDGDGMPDC
jgi:hypothetical protein